MADEKISELTEANRIALFQAGLKGSNYKIYKGIVFIDLIDSITPRLKQTNRGDQNALSGVSISRAAEGIHHIDITGGDKFNMALTEVYIGTPDTWSHIAKTHTENSKIIINVADNTLTYADAIINGTAIMIIVRQYGAAFTIVSAATNLIGNKVILNCSEDIHPDFYEETLAASPFTFSGGKNVASYAPGLSSDQVEITLDASYANGDVITFDYDNTLSGLTSGYQILSVDYGKLTSVTGKAVTNNVPA